MFGYYIFARAVGYTPHYKWLDRVEQVISPTSMDKRSKWLCFNANDNEWEIWDVQSDVILIEVLSIEEAWLVVDLALHNGLIDENYNPLVEK